MLFIADPDACLRAAVRCTTFVISYRLVSDGFQRSCEHGFLYILNQGPGEFNRSARAGELVQKDLPVANTHPAIGFSYTSESRGFELPDLRVVGLGDLRCRAPMPRA